MRSERLVTHLVGIEKFAEQGGQRIQLFIVSLIACDDRARPLESRARVIQRARSLRRSDQEEQGHQRNGQDAHQSRSSLPVRWRKTFSRLSGAILMRTSRSERLMIF